MSMHQIEWSFYFSDSRDLPGMAFIASKQQDINFVPSAGLCIFFDHWELDFWLKISWVDWNIKTGVFSASLVDHEGALDFQEWDTMEAFFLEQGWEVSFPVGRPGDPDEEAPSDIDFKHA